MCHTGKDGGMPLGSPVAPWGSCGHSLQPGTGPSLHEEFRSAQTQTQARAGTGGTRAKQGPQAAWKVQTPPGRGGRAAMGEARVSWLASWGGPGPLPERPPPAPCGRPSHTPVSFSPGLFLPSGGCGPSLHPTRVRLEAPGVRRHVGLSFPVTVTVMAQNRPSGNVCPLCPEMCGGPGGAGLGRHLSGEQPLWGALIFLKNGP